LALLAFRSTNAERTVVAPAYVLNYGFAENWELVVEGRAEHPLAPAEDTQSRLVGDALFLKGVLRDPVTNTRRRLIVELARWADHAAGVCGCIRPGQRSNKVFW
jgi:hypothetical protein